MRNQVIAIRLRLSHVLIAVSMLLAGIGLGIAGQMVFAQDGTTFVACVDSNRGLMRLVGDASQCDANEYATSWESGGSGGGGLSTVQLRSEILSVTEAAPGVIACLSGEQVTGGGWRYAGGPLSGPFGSYPVYGVGDGSQEGWTVVVGGGGVTTNMEVYALCAS